MRIKRICELCGAEYWTGNGKAKYCSEDCRKEATKRRQKKWRADHPDYHKEYFREHPEALERFKERHPDYERDRWRKIRSNEEHTKQCVVCGKTFTTWRSAKITCSAECKHEMEASRLRKRQLPASQIVDANITLKRLYERDHGICYLCGEKCDWSDRDEKKNSIGMLYPTIDHVIPVSKGGLHAWDNVKLAHMICNAIKQDKILVKEVG